MARESNCNNSLIPYSFDTVDPTQASSCASLSDGLLEAYLDFNPIPVVLGGGRRQGVSGSLLVVNNPGCLDHGALISAKAGSLFAMSCDRR